MPFFVDFLFFLLRMILDFAPVLIMLVMLISGLAIFVGRREGWPVIDCLYYGFITATTVGYGDMVPRDNINKFIAILIAIFGMILTGIIVAIAVEAASQTYDTRKDVTTSLLSETTYISEA